MNASRILLPNGLRIVYECLPHLSTVSIGVFVNNGSRHESERQAGISHFIEHMVFKGTDRLCTAELADALDRIGGQANAYTTKETTCFYTTCLSRHLTEAAGLLADMLLHPRLLQSDVDTERGVILEEIAMYEDNPEDLVAELLSRRSLAGCPVGRPILGTPATLSGINGEMLRTYMQRHYTGSNIVLALSGSLTESDINALCEIFSAFPAGNRNRSRKTVYTPCLCLREKPIEQAHLALRYPGLPYTHPDRFALRLLNAVFGEGMSSRLFQRVRERDGLCYSIGAVPASVSDAGFYDIYTATGRESLSPACRAISQEVERLLCDGISEEELCRAKDQTEAGLFISLESTAGRMSLLARHEQRQGKAPCMAKIVQQYREVTREQVLGLARRLWTPESLSLAAVGNLSEEILHSTTTYGIMNGN